jgi:hypothetical protein
VLEPNEEKSNITFGKTALTSFKLLNRNKNKVKQSSILLLDYVIHLGFKLLGWILQTFYNHYLGRGALLQKVIVVKVSSCFE